MEQTPRPSSPNPAPFTVGPRTARLDGEVVRLRRHGTGELLRMAADVAELPGATTELEREALACVLREKAQGRS